MSLELAPLFQTLSYENGYLDHIRSVVSRLQHYGAFKSLARSAKATEEYILLVHLIVPVAFAQPRLALRSGGTI